MKLSNFLIASVVAGFAASSANAALSNHWANNGFTMISNKDGVFTQQANSANKLHENQVAEYDAQYLYFKREGNTLTIGLQSRFNLKTGQEASQNESVDAGEIAFSFGGASTNTTARNYYDYAVDFGLETWQMYGNRLSNAKDAGVYTVSQNGWSQLNKQTATYNGGVFASKADSRTLKAALLSNNVFKLGDDFARVVSFDLSKFGYTEQDKFQLNAYWTMACGNDTVWGSSQVDATSEVPVPAAVWLFGSALLGLGFKKRK